MKDFKLSKPDDVNKTIEQLDSSKLGSVQHRINIDKASKCLPELKQTESDKIKANHVWMTDASGKTSKLVAPKNIELNKQNGWKISNQKKK